MKLACWHGHEQWPYSQVTNTLLLEIHFTKQKVMQLFGSQGSSEDPLVQPSLKEIIWLLSLKKAWEKMAKLCKMNQRIVFYPSYWRVGKEPKKFYNSTSWESIGRMGVVESSQSTQKNTLPSMGLSAPWNYPEELALQLAK